MDDIRANAPCDILILTDAGQSPHAVIEGLTELGLDVRLTTNSEFVMWSAANSPPALVLLLPDRLAAPGGIQTVERLRARHALPCVIQAAAEDGVQQRVAALRAGADEVLHGGTPATEVVACIQAMLRRMRRSLAPVSWRLAASGRMLESPNGELQRLTSAEYTLVTTLAAAAGEPVDRHVISERVFRRPWRPDDRAVDSLVKRVRRKLPPDAIQSVRSVGYALAVPVEFMPAHVEICVPNKVLASPPSLEFDSRGAPVAATKRFNGKD